MLYNNAIQIKRDILYRTAKAISDENYDQLDRIPIETAPRDNKNIRCCVHKDRAILKYRVMAALGYSIEDETDELKRLSEYASEIGYDVDENRILTVIADACRSCKLGHHYVTDICVGCVARPCLSSCPKDAITMVNGRSVIDTDKCINCGKCTSVCPYNAIVKIPVPCEVSCPVDALKKDEFGVETIDSQKCISCGKCTKSCPFGAIVDKSQMVQVIKALNSPMKVHAFVAPSVVGQFPGSISQIKQAITSLGYESVTFIAGAADKVAESEAIEYKENNGVVLTSSCCPSYIECVEKHAKDMSSYVSHTPSPMVLAAQMSEKQSENDILVFIGPCIAKKIEAQKTGAVDYVITFEELGAQFMSSGCEIQEFENIDESVNINGFNFAGSGGVLSGVKSYLQDMDISIKGENINGIDKSVVKRFKHFDKFKKNYDFLEVMSCEGGCLNGPGVVVSDKVCRKALTSLNQKNKLLI